MAPKTRGVSVFTRPPRISGAPDQVATGVTSIPALARCFAVPPVDKISTFFERSAFARSMMPVLSETERIARSIRILNDARRTHGCRRANVAAGLSPDVVLEVDDVGDGVGVTDGGDAKRGGAVVEVRRCAPRTSAEILFAHQRAEPRGAHERPFQILGEREPRVEAIEHRREALHPPLEVVLEVRM